MNGGHVRLRRLSARDFRNLERLDLDLPDAGVAIIGENGQGKTNLLEAIYYLQILRSVRGARDQDLVRFGAKAFHVSATIDSRGPGSVSAGFETSTRRKKVSVDGSMVARLSEGFGSLPSVMFSPRDIQLVAGGPSERRRYLDLVLALSSRRYLVALQTYRAALARRNAALRESLRSGNDGSVAVWEPALAEFGAALICERAAWVRASAVNFAALVEAIGEGREVRMSYQSALAREDNIGEALLESLSRQRKHDMRRGITHSGPHRDDLTLTLDGKDLRVFGSAGQQRTAAIALRMLEGSTLRESRGESPVLLLDDPFAELDVRRSARILGLLASEGLGQTILVVPRAGDIPPELTSLERRSIREGAIAAA